MEKLKERLADYQLKTIAVDIDSNSLQKNTADEKIIANAEHLPFEKVDVAIMRYVLQWNTPERQKNILKELSKKVGEFALVEHAGADSIDSEEWREHMNELLSGKDLSKLKRDESFLSSQQEIEDWMEEMGIKYKTIQSRKINQMSNAFIERWNLNGAESSKVKEILGDKDYLIQTDWVIFPK